MSANEPPRVAYAAAADHLYVAVAGSATHQASIAAEHLLRDFLASQPARPVVVLDLDGCSWVDSTFAGWMVRLRQQLGPDTGRVVVARCPVTCHDSLQVMGLTPLFEFHDVHRPPHLNPLPCAPLTDDVEALELMADAHRRLADLSPENRETFARIAEELSREFKRRTH